MKGKHATRYALMLLCASFTIVATGAHPGAVLASATTLFGDGFESGDFAAWSLVKTGADGTATVQGSVVEAGSYAAQFSESASPGSYAYARKTLPAAQASLDASADVEISAIGSATQSVPLLRLYDASGARLVNLYRSNVNGAVWVQHSGAYYRTSGTIALNAWAHVELDATTAGSGASAVQVWLNGALVYQTSTASLGTAGVLTVQIGNEAASQPFTQAVDNVTITTTGPTLATSPASALPFQMLTVTGTNFDPGESVSLYWDRPGALPLATTTTTAVGSFNARVGVPQTISGTHMLIAVGRTSGISAAATIQIAPKTSLRYTSGAQGTLDVLTGYGFGSNETVQASWETAGKLVLGSAATNDVGTFSGSSAITFTIPLSASGYYCVQGVGLRSGTQASSAFTVTTSASTTTPLTPVVQRSATATPMPLSPTGEHAIKTVFLIVLENHDWTRIKCSSSAPYINNILLPIAAHAEQYYDPPGNHPSLPNYLWLEAGTNFGITDDNGPSSHPLSSTSHLTTLLDQAGLSWKAYEENIDGTSCPLTDRYPYAVRHDPFVYFDDVTGNQSADAPYCIAHVRPYTELAGDLRNDTVARYNFITPNVCDDGHDSCAPLGNQIAQTDSWLSSAVPVILNSQAYKDGGALFITWDEGSWTPTGDSDGPIGMIVLSPFAKGDYANAIPYTHSSTLRTLQEIFGVGPWLGDAANATDLSDLFTTFP